MTNTYQPFTVVSLEGGGAGRYPPTCMSTLKHTHAQTDTNGGIIRQALSQACRDKHFAAPGEPDALTIHSESKVTLL